MDVNPYESPKTLSSLTTRPQAFRSYGGCLFVFLGIVFVVLPVGAVVSALTDSRTPRNVVLNMSAGSTILIMLGALLILHGVVRSKATIRLLVFPLAIGPLLILFLLTLAVLF